MFRLKIIDSVCFFFTDCEPNIVNTAKIYQNTSNDTKRMDGCIDMPMRQSNKGKIF